MSKPNEIKPFSLRVKEDLDKLHIKPESIIQNIEEDIPPWTYRYPDVDLTISSLKKSLNTPEIYMEIFLKCIEKHKDYTKLYTDGSKDGSKVGCAVFEKQFSAKLRLPNNASIFTAEAKAIDLALSYISQHNKDKFAIFSDSLSVLTSLKNRSTNNILIKNLILRFHNILSTKSIKLIWIPSHVGICGNETVDSLAKESLKSQPINLKSPSTDFKPSINTFIS